MTQWALPPGRLLHKEISGGPLCFHKDHNIGARDGRIPRYSDSHACVRCVAALTEGRFSIDVHRIERKYRRNFLTFWSLVDIDDPDACWDWQGPISSRGTCTFAIPRHWTSGRQFAAHRSAFWFSHGDIGRLPLKRLCSNPRCCNPLHYKAHGVPHFFHRRHLKEIDLNFNNRKLLGETTLFLNTMSARDPVRFQKIESVNQLWIRHRMNAGGPVSVDDIQQQLTENQ